jgi:hypothetical protein
MTCIHLRKLYQLCQDEHLRIGGSDLVRIVCHQCGEQEVCPSLLTDEYEQSAHEEEESAPPSSDSAPG